MNNIIQYPWSLVLRSILDQLNSLCDDEKIKFSYYNSIISRSYIFRFEKNGKAIKYGITYIDIMSKNIDVIMDEINSKLIELYDSITKR